MTTQAVLLLLVSAFIHASWNYLSKRNRASLSFFLTAVLMSVIFFSPIGWLHRRWLPQIPPVVWALLVLTAGFQAMYYFGLAGAYRRGELSVIYPLVRSLPVLMVAGMSALLGRGEQIGVLGFAGMVLVAGGCLVLPMRSFSLRLGLAPLNPALLLALLAAVGTTGYTLIDDTALRLLRALPGPAALGIQQASQDVQNVSITLLYTFLEGTSILAWLAALVALLPAERREMRSMVRQARLQAALTGIFMLAAYGIVLVAMAYVRDVSYVAAFRQTSIPIGALAGLIFEKEKAYAPKVVGILSITTGLLLVAVG